MNIITWFQNHWVDLAAMYAGLVTVATIFVRLTPTLKDDTWLLAFTKWVAKYVALARTVNDNAVRGQLAETPKEE